MLHHVQLQCVVLFPHQMQRPPMAVHLLSQSLGPLGEPEELLVVQFALADLVLQLACHRHDLSALLLDAIELRADKVHIPQQIARSHGFHRFSGFLQYPLDIQLREVAVLIDHVPQPHGSRPLLLRSCFGRVDNGGLCLRKGFLEIVDGMFKGRHAADRFTEDILNHVHVAGVDIPQRKIAGMNLVLGKGQILSDEYDGVAPHMPGEKKRHVRDRRAGREPPLILYILHEPCRNSVRHP